MSATTTWDSRPLVELGVCVGSTSLVPGDVLGMRAYAGRLRTVARGADAVVRLLSRVEAGVWSGQSAAEFREVLSAAPAPYMAVGEALGGAARVVDAYADEIEAARLVADRMQWQMDEADRVTRDWEAAQERARLLQVPRLPGPVAPPVPLPCDDPGEVVRQRARRTMGDAQEEVAQAAARAVRVLSDAADRAPAERGAVGDLVAVGRGAGTGLWSLGTVLGDLVVHPIDTTTGLARGVAEAATHPVDTLSAEGDTFADDPEEYLGGLLAGGAAARALQLGTRNGRHDEDRGPEPPPNPHGRAMPTEEQWRHIELGEFNVHGKPVGYHHRPGGVDAPGRTLGEVLHSDANGAYSVKPVYFKATDGTWKPKPRSTFFPDDWSPERVRLTVLDAWLTARPENVKAGGAWRGTAYGFRVEGFVAPDGSMATAWPRIGDA